MKSSEYPSVGIVQFQPTEEGPLSLTPFVSSLARPSRHEGRASEETGNGRQMVAFGCRPGLNDPPTAVGGILGPVEEQGWRS